MKRSKSYNNAYNQFLSLLKTRDVSSYNFKRKFPSINTTLHILKANRGFQFEQEKKTSRNEKVLILLQHMFLTEIKLKSHSVVFFSCVLNL